MARARKLVAGKKARAKKAKRASGAQAGSHVYSADDGPLFSAHFHLEPGASATAAEKALRAAGLEAILTSPTRIVTRARRKSIESLVGVGLNEKGYRRQVNRCQHSVVRRSYAGLPSEEPPPLDTQGMGRFVFPVPFHYWQAPSAYPPRVPYYHLHPAHDLPLIFGVEALHARGIRGQGSRVVMIDSGFYRHPYYEERALHGGATPQITTDGVLALASDPEVDDVGHGTGIAANVLALAPECDFHHIKDDGDPVAAMIMARALNPQLITCSWGWPEDYVDTVFSSFPNSGAAAYLRDLETAIQGAIADGVTVLFASGNGPAPGSWPSSVPGVVSVGGALVDENLELLASSYATSFASLVTPGRVCPDICGLVGPGPSGLLLALPTQPNNQLDNAFSASDGTQPGDGWLIASGTSSATPQVAAIVALLLQMQGPMAPADVLEWLRGMAIGVHQGTTASGHPATAARPNAATGHGFVAFRRPQLANSYTGLY